MNLDEVSLSIKIKLGLLVGLLVLAVSLIMSNNAMPSSPDLYRLKRFQEKVFMGLKLSPEEKVKYYGVLLNKRFEELNFLVENRQFTYIRTSSLRYSTTAGRMTELITANDLVNAVKPTKNTFEKHQIIFSQLVKDYPFKDSEEWKYLQDDYNYLDIYLGFLSEIE